MKITRLDVPQCSVGEGPVWDVQDQRLYWIDILGKAVYCLDPATGATRRWPVPNIIGSMAIRKDGGAIVAQTDDLAPVEGKFYSLRKETGTIPSLPLITGSVLSKKLAEGSEGLVIDVKWGNGSFIKDLEQAKQLARSMTRVGRSMKRRCVALVTDMNQPLGDTVGTSLEVKEAIQLLKGEGPEDMKELVLKLGMEIVRLAGVAGSTLSAKQTVQKHLTDGSALEKCGEVVALPLARALELCRTGVLLDSKSEIALRRLAERYAGGGAP